MTPSMDRVPYKILEVSIKGFRIESTEYFAVGDGLFCYGYSQTPISIEVVSRTKVGEFFHYYMMSSDPFIDFTDWFKPHGGREAVRSVRINPTRVFRVKAGTFGSRSYYDCLPLNVSASGMLIESAVAKMPFLVGTLLEIEIDASEAGHSELIVGVARVVRLVEGVGRTQPAKIGLKFLELMKSGDHVWKGFLATMEQDLYTSMLPRRLVQ